MIEFVCIYWELRDRWTVVFANGAQLIGDELRSLHDAESAALETLCIDRAAFKVEHDDTTKVCRYRCYGKRVQVRALDEVERARVRECLEWLQFPGIREGEPDDSDDNRTRARYDQRLDEARKRWPDVARLMGF